ncbi:MAG: CMP-N,N'-diacetyllegionaminic acid synthase [Oleiphilaceae bacterium]
MKYLAIIPARAGSKGVPNKNIRAINGHPLIAWSIRQALNVSSITNVVVSTDSDQIAEIAKKYGAEVPFIRPLELAQDETATEPVMSHSMDWYSDNGIEYDAVILLQPTSPLRLSDSLQRAIDCFELEKVSSLLSVCKSHAFFWQKSNPVSATYDYENRPRRQDIEDEQCYYKETGSIYITKKNAFNISNNRLVEPILPFEMEQLESYEIDSEVDFKVIESLMNYSSVTLPEGRFNS